MREPGLDLSGSSATIEDDEDALDAVLCSFAGKAVTENQLVSGPEGYAQ